MKSEKKWYAACGGMINKSKSHGRDTCRGFVSHVDPEIPLGGPPELLLPGLADGLL